ncbi:MAG: ferrous iron transport protein B [Candidatus Melainabacteria bacterium GWF2_37_15]|nr:MAG: ferrous iron transport protein B [Candidatus Melainabacteria bacterium GWF2_37_15]
MCKDEGQPKIALVGNPNVGKSAMFNALTGCYYAEVSNYPGTTVDVSKAFIKEGEIIDTPGAYSIGNYTDDEVVTRKIIEKSDIIINVTSALSLERDLFLTYQLLELDLPLIVVVNQTDEAKIRGIQIDFEKLENLLGVKVIPAVAVANKGISEILKSIRDKEYKLSCHQLSVKEKIAQILELDNDSIKKEQVYSEIRKNITQIIAEVISEVEKQVNISYIVGNLLLNPYIGAITTIFMLYLLYKVVGVFIAGDLVNFLENEIIATHYIPWITEIVVKIIPSGAINEILIGEFGILTMTVQYLIGVLLPMIFGFYIFMSILEDSGYLPRLAVLSDRFMSKIGLNGRAIIPVILGFGCVTMATITTRILGSKRERTIATAILNLIVPCSAQIGIILGLIAVIGGLVPWLIYLSTLFILMALVGTALNRLLPGKSTDLFIELPPMRVPLLKNVLSKTLVKTWYFLQEATPIFILGFLIISVLHITNALAIIQHLFEPLTVGLLNLPKETANMFIMGLIRRDFGAAGLAEMAGMGGGTAILNNIQILVSLIVLTLFVPCIAAVVMLFKERGFKEATFIWFGSWVLAFGTGAIISRILYFFLNVL